MSKQQIFSFSLDINSDNELIGDLLSRKNRSSYIRLALRNMEKRKKEIEEFDRLYEDYERTVKLYRMLWEQHKDEKCNFIAKSKSQYKD